MKASVVTAHVGRVLLAAAMLVAGTAHLVNTGEFLGQVPTWLPWRDAIVLASGVVELGFGAALLLASADRRPVVGWALALFFVLVFPGNVNQWITGSDAFGLDTDGARFLRLLFQPLLVVWALWCTGAWSWWRDRRAAQRHPNRAL